MEYLPAKTIVTRYIARKDWFGWDYNMNLYRGCCHGCIYCDSRSDCYGIQEFGTVRAKENALTLVRDDLRRKVLPGVVGTGSMSDPYNPHEAELLLTRHALELLNAYEFGVSIVTKSDLITRDLDILLDIRSHSPVLCLITVTTADDGLSRVLEREAPLSSRRLKAIQTLSAAGIYTGVLLMPVLPFITDGTDSIRELVKQAAGHGARFVYTTMGMTLRDSQRAYYYQSLDKSFPGLRERYERTYDQRLRCAVPNAKKRREAFMEACDQNGLLYEMTDIVKAYKQGYGERQFQFR